MISQLPLGLQLRDDATFDNFLAGSNQQLISSLQNNAFDKFTFIWGPNGVGRSHLLQACCHDESNCFFIPLSESEELSPPIFDGLENVSLICIDDIDHIVGKPEWEEALFHFYNRVLETDARIIIASTTPPNELAIKLPDLKTRLTSFIVFELHTLSDDEKLLLLQQRAKLRGLEMSDEVAEFLFHRLPRDMSVLSEVLDKLDEASMVAKRRLTIPFVRDVLDLGVRR